MSALPDLLHLTPCSPTCTCAPCLLYGRITLLRNPEDHENTVGASPSALPLPPMHVGGLVLSVSHMCKRQQQAEFSLWPSQCLQAMLRSTLAQNHPPQIPSAGLFLLGTNNREMVLELPDRGHCGPLGKNSSLLYETFPRER